MVAARDPAPVAMSSYEELKRRVAALKQVDREETAARKAVAAQENAEVARAKAAMLAKEKENDERLHAAKKALHAATERSQACLLYTSPSPRDGLLSRMPSSA